MILWILTPIGRIFGLISMVILLSTGAYLKGRHDGISSYKLAIEKEISDAVRKGNKARADALRKFDAGRMSESWFID